MLHGTSRVIAVWAVLLLTLAVNAASALLPLNGLTPEAISDSYNSLFTPAGYVFSIWSVIYIAMVVFAVYQGRGKQKTSAQFDRLGLLFIVANLANSLWLFLWHYEYIAWSILPMLVILGSLIGMHRIAYNMKGSSEHTWMVKVPVSLYLGWISVATIANAAVVLLELGWDGAPLSPELWTWIVSGVAVLLAGAMVMRHRDWTYAVVIAWALIGVAVKFV